MFFFNINIIIYSMYFKFGKYRYLTHTGMNTYMLPQIYVVFAILTFYTNLVRQCKH